MPTPRTSANETVPAPPRRFLRRRTVVLIVAALLGAATIRGIAEYAEAQHVKPLPGPSVNGFGSLAVTYGQRAQTPSNVATFESPGGLPGAVPGAMPGTYSSPSGVGIHITLADGQTIDLRANDIVLTFPGGGSLRATENGVLPLTSAVPGTMPAMTPSPMNPNTSDFVGSATAPPDIDLPRTETPAEGDDASGVAPNTRGFQPVEQTPLPRLQEQLNPGTDPASTLPQ